MDEALQRGHMIQLPDMLLTVQHRLIQVGGSPAQRHMEVQHLGELLGSGAGASVPPSAEGGQQGALLIEGEVAVHHGADARAREAMQGNAVLFLHLLFQRGITALQAADDVLHGVRPQAVFQPVLPIVGAHRQR